MGSVTINGSTSGSITVAAPAVAGSNTLTLPAATGTVITTASSAALPVSAINATGTPSASTYLRGDGAWAGVSGQLIRAPQILTSGTSYTTPAGCNNIFIEMIGGGGGGSGNNRTDTSAATGGGGGGASPYGSVYVAVTPSTSYTYAIGAGGAGLSGTGTATTGGTTSITIGATTYSCSGGVGGNTTGNNNNGTGGAAGTATNMSVTITPIASTCPAGGSISCPLGFGIGGMRFFLTLGLNGGTTTGQAGIGWGAGGGGSWNQTATGTTTGGAGSQGIIRIWEYT